MGIEMTKNNSEQLKNEKVSTQNWDIHLASTVNQSN